MKLLGTAIELTTRRKVVIFSMLFTFLYFILATPISSFLTNIVTPPIPLSDITITRTNSFSGENIVDTITISWDEPTELDIARINVSLTPENGEGESLSTEAAPNSQSIEFNEINTDVAYTGEISVVDITNIENKTPIAITTLFDEAGESLFSQTNIVNRGVDSGNALFSILVRLAILVMFLLLGSLWITQFAVKSVKQVVIAIYPTSISIPYLYLTLGYLFRETSFTQYLLASITSIVLFAISYLVLLTMNILYASTFTDLPLAQAAKAAQFVFSLIASYLIFVMFFGSVEGLFVKVVLIAVSLFYFTFSSLLLQKSEADTVMVLVKSIAVSLTMIFAVFVLATWPVNYIFAMLAAAILYYIILNVSLEVKYKISDYIWGEYVLLVLLVVALLVLNSSWGINGSLF